MRNLTRKQKIKLGHKKVRSNYSRKREAKRLGLDITATWAQIDKINKARARRGDED
ncbi:hypothetical protein LCGC14_0923680 [marine sediment metagenome]|uniref:Uncharacterized protein n=1 Tax=marine sediment metagenome TaxID=412755 RepID=A0A0F9RWK1_9ZZZZ